MEYEFELDKPKGQKRKAQESADPMQYELKFGKYKGVALGAIMKVQRGRSYLQWLQERPNEDPDYKEAQDMLNEKIKQCFELYRLFLEKKK